MYWVFAISLSDETGWHMNTLARAEAGHVVLNVIQSGFSLPPGRALDICVQLQTAIFEHRLEPGAKLSEDEVGEFFDASRTVVRAALHALAHSGLVSIEKNRGAFVAKPGIREAHEVFEARALIEPRIAGMAALLATADDIARLRANIDAEHVAMHAGDTGRALGLSGSFHLIISAIANHGVFDGMVRSLISRSSLVIALYWRRLDTACESHSHDALMKAIEAHRQSDAEALMKSHIIDLHSGLDLTEKAPSSRKLSEILMN
jgi:DNA-binding GntR family transcriptional regulator